MVINLVGGFHALGTLLAVGIMMLPAAIGALLGARHHRCMIADRDRLAARRRAMPACCCPSTPASPSGPAIILVAGALYVVSLLFGRVGGLVRQAFPGRHLEA